MKLDRKTMYNFPWSKTDNPGSWIEVTDICNLSCPGCFRKNNFEGHRSFEEIKKEIFMCKEMTNCSRLSISGGEPLLYPHIVDTVRFISSLKLKPIILSNGEVLTPDLAKDLKKAGLFQFFFHVDSGQNRPGWINRTEAEMNELRQHYVDLIHKTGRITSGFNMTVRYSNLKEVPDVVKWYRANIDRCTHLSFITFRGIPVDLENILKVKGEKISFEGLPDAIKHPSEINISSVDILDKIAEDIPYMHVSAYQHGTTKTDTYKVLTINTIGTNNQTYGAVGAKTMEIYQVIYHLLHHRYDATIPKIGKLIFFMSLFDRQVSKAMGQWLKASLRNPAKFFRKVHLQSLVIQQPFEVIDGELNLCDGCINLMPYKGEMINSCRLDEYRLLGGPIKFS